MLSEMYQKSDCMTNLLKFMGVVQTVDAEAVMLICDDINIILDSIEDKKKEKPTVALLEKAKDYIMAHGKDKYVEMVNLLPNEYVSKMLVDMSGTLVEQDAVIPERPEGSNHWSYNRNSWENKRLYLRWDISKAGASGILYPVLDTFKGFQGKASEKYKDKTFDCSVYGYVQDWPAGLKKLSTGVDRQRFYAPMTVGASNLFDGFAYLKDGIEMACISIVGAKFPRDVSEQVTAELKDVAAVDAVVTP